MARPRHQGLEIQEVERNGVAYYYIRWRVYSMELKDGKLQMDKGIAKERSFRKDEYTRRQVEKIRDEIKVSVNGDETPFAGEVTVSEFLKTYDEKWIEARLVPSTRATQP